MFLFWLLGIVVRSRWQSRYSPLTEALLRIKRFHRPGVKVSPLAVAKLCHLAILASRDWYDKYLKLPPTIIKTMMIKMKNRTGRISMGIFCYLTTKDVIGSILTASTALYVL